MAQFNPLDYPICLSKPSRIVPPLAWIQHTPFAMFLVEITRPRLLVELGTHIGNSYCAFCQAVKELNLDTKCYAVDTWQGDIHAGYYGSEVLADLRAHHDPLYGGFSHLMQSTFDEAVGYFSDGTIDLLHIDGLHTYDAVKHDFENWLPKLSSQAIVVFHDITVREQDFGVWRLWDELKIKYPFFEFAHGHGLGILAVGQSYPPSLDILFKSSTNAPIIREFFSQMGFKVEVEFTIRELSAQVRAQEQIIHSNEQKNEQKIEALNTELSDLEEQLNTIHSSIIWRMFQPFQRINRYFIRMQNSSLIRTSGLFDPTWYLANNSDVAQSGIDPLRHYLQNGGFEGRDPSPNFNSSWYLNEYRDAKISGENPLVHYLKHGKAQGRAVKKSLVPHGPAIQITKKKTRSITYAISTLSEFITVQQIRKAWRYLIRGDIKSIRHILSFLYRKATPSFTDEELELTHCAKYFRSKTEERFQVDPNQETDIIVPVFNGIEFLPALFASLFKNTDTPFRVIIVDDNSPDPSVRHFLEKLAEEHKNILLLFNEENKGFVKTINIAATHVQNHFVILNTDVEVPKGWLQRLMKPIIDDPKVASTTPFTNAGTICSFPQPHIDNPIFAGLNVNAVDSAFEQIDPGNTRIELPTGIGFCMGINWNVWKQIGSFDEERFGQGYGEENDWCMRAVAAGYHNLLAPNLFVYHKHGGSFPSQEKQKLMNENLEKLLDLYPNYQSRVLEFVAADSPKALRKFASLILMSESSVKNPILIVDHQIGGGANLYRDRMVHQFLEHDQAVLILTYEPNWRAMKLQVLFREYAEAFKVEHARDLLILEKYVILSEIYYNNLVTYPDPLSVVDVLAELKDAFQAKLNILIHDYYVLCPSYTLADYKGKFCNLPDESVCKVCLPRNDNRLPINKNSVTNISTWRESWSNLIAKADKVICFSKSSQELLLRIYDLKSEQFSIQPHKFVSPFTRKPHIDLNSPLNIGVFGAINYHKGSQMVLDVAKILAIRYPDYKITVVGIMEHFIDLPNLTVVGPYKQSELPDLIEKHQINLCFFPSIIPETFSFVTSELIDLEMPICCFNIGAPAERVEQYKLGRLISNIDPETAVRSLVDFYNQLRETKEILINER